MDIIGNLANFAGIPSGGADDDDDGIDLNLELPAGERSGNEALPQDEDTTARDFQKNLINNRGTLNENFSVLLDDKEDLRKANKVLKNRSISIHNDAESQRTDIKANALKLAEQKQFREWGNCVLQSFVNEKPVDDSIPIDPDGLLILLRDQSWTGQKLRKYFDENKAKVKDICVTKWPALCRAWEEYADANYHNKPFTPKFTTAGEPDFAELLIKTGPPYLHKHPQIREWLIKNPVAADKILKQQPDLVPALKPSSTMPEGWKENVRESGLVYRVYNRAIKMAGWDQGPKWGTIGLPDEWARCEPQRSLLSELGGKLRAEYQKAPHKSNFEEYVKKQSKRITFDTDFAALAQRYIDDIKEHYGKNTAAAGHEEYSIPAWYTEPEIGMNLALRMKPESSFKVHDSGSKLRLFSAGMASIIAHTHPNPTRLYQEDYVEPLESQKEENSKKVDEAQEALNDYADNIASQLDDAHQVLRRLQQDEKNIIKMEQIYYQAHEKGFKYIRNSNGKNLIKVNSDESKYKFQPSISRMVAPFESAKPSEVYLGLESKPR